MEKLDLLRFRALKQEIIDNITKYRMALEGRLDFSDEDGWADFSDGEGTSELSDEEDWVDFSDEEESSELSDEEDWVNLSDEDAKIIVLEDEEQKQFLERYKEIIRVLSEHDLSDIDFEEWEGMYLFTSEENPLDFSKNKANIDFSIIEYYAYKTFPNFKSCQIKNFDFEKHDYFPEMFNEEYREENKDRFLSEELPESVRENYYRHNLSMQEFSEYLQYFEGKKVVQSFKDYEDERKIISLYGEGIYQLFADYKPIMDMLLSDNIVMEYTEFPTEPVTEEQRKEIIGSAIQRYINRNGYKRVQNWDEFKMILDFIPLVHLTVPYVTTELIKKYGIDKIIESGIDIKCLLQNKKITSLEEILNIQGIDIEDVKELVDEHVRIILDRYDVKKLIEYGITDWSELPEVTNDLHQVKEMLEKIPIDLINMDKEEKEFIKKYGIDNIIAMDEETNGIFSHHIWKDHTYLTLFAREDGRTTKLESEEQLTYEQFSDRMYKILLQARAERGFLTTRDYPDYDFIQGKFRKDHPEIFIDGDISEEVKRAFYTRHMTAELVRQNPGLIQLLQGKDLSRAFPKQMTAGISMQMMSKDGKTIGGIPNTVNMAQYLSEKLGQEEFLKICADYGKYLDDIGISIKNEITVGSVRNTIEQAIYKGIKERKIQYSEDLPLSFQEKHLELFLTKDIDEKLRTRFYSGKLTYEDVRRNPQIKDLLLTKDISVGFGEAKYGQPMLGRSGQRYVNPMWEKLSEQEIMDYAEKYGTYLKFVDANIFVEGQTYEERIKVLQDNIERNILDRKSLFNPSSVPAFFKEIHPDMFLDSNAPDELKDAFYDSAAVGEHIYQGGIDFELIKANPEWKKFLQGKDLSRAFPEEYSGLFKRFDSATLMKLGTRSPETIERMVQNHKEDVLENWYKSTGGKFIPHHVVMLNFPEGEIDSFLGNSKRWSQLMRIENYNLNDDSKTAMLKVAYTMGVFQGNDDGFNKTIKLFTDVPQELTKEEYDRVVRGPRPCGRTYRDMITSVFEQAYTLNDSGKYVFGMDKQKNKDSVRIVRELLEKVELPRILTPQKAHQMFDSFAMEYNPDFVKFLNENIEEILSNPELTKDIAAIQRQFSEIVKTNSGRRLTLDVAQDYIKSIAYTDIEIGNEGVAEQAKIAGYSQKDFEAIQSLFNEGETRDFSSIPRIQGKTKGYSYEMLRCDDPLALTIGTLTDCCQEIHGAGQTSMEHSVVSPDGRVFVVRDEEGKVVAQSWFWRNQYTGCFDNIEIPDRIFDLYRKQHPDIGKKGLTTEVLEVYKKAAQDLMQEDARVYKELLENGTITKEQYDAVLLGKVTIGLGYNDIADAIQADKTIHKEKDNVRVRGTDRLPHPYTDASTQYTIAEREGIVKSEHENLYVHQDDVPVYDGTNMSTTVLRTMKRMEEAVDRDNLAYLREREDEENLPKSQRIINSIAREYGLEPNNTKVIATARIALIYSKDEDRIKIGDLLSSPIKEGLTDEQKQKATAHIKYQVKKALKQIGIQGSEVDLSSLNEEQQQMLQSIMQEIEKENAERGER